MKKRILILGLVLSLLLLCTACHTSDSLVCEITAKDGQMLTLKVLGEDLHYEAEEELLVHYRTIANGKSLSIGDVVTFSYNYVEDVTVKNTLPYIEVESVTLTTFVPTEPEETTEATETVETTEAPAETVEETETVPEETEAE